MNPTKDQGVWAAAKFQFGFMDLNLIHNMKEIEKTVVLVNPTEILVDWEVK